MVKIRIKPKIPNLSHAYENAETMNERQRETRERQEEYCDEIRSLRCEMETMKTAMDFGKQATSETFSKDSTSKIVESYKKQVEEITAFNKKSFESLNSIESKELS